MTGAEIMGAIGFALTLAYAMWFAWGRVETKVKGVEDKADKALERLAQHQLHIAETYATKAGMSEQTAQIMKALDAVGAKIDYTNGRLDSFMQPKARTTR